MWQKLPKSCESFYPFVQTYPDSRLLRAPPHPYALRSVSRRRLPPIASGVIEGACRHVVKDRIERAGTRWYALDPPPGHQALLDLHYVALNGDWVDVMNHYAQQETAGLYANSPIQATSEPF